MKNIIIFKVLLIGGLLFSSLTYTYGSTGARLHVLSQDVFVFKVGGAVFGRRDLHDYYLAGNYYNCNRKYSLINMYFSNIFKKENIKKFNHKVLSISKDESLFFTDFIPFTKVLMYSKSFDQQIDFEEELKTLKTARCLKRYKISNINMTKLKELVTLDTFLQNRFLPQVKGYIINENDISKANEAVRNLINSISKQIEQEVYW